MRIIGLMLILSRCAMILRIGWRYRGWDEGLMMRDEGLTINDG